MQENLKALLRHEHDARIRLLLEETLDTFNGYFFVTLYLNAAVQRVSFGYIAYSSTFNDVRFRLHILQPYAEPGKEASNYFNLRIPHLHHASKSLLRLQIPMSSAAFRIH